MPGNETWSSRLIFLFAAVGAAVGLANIWKFPYTAGQHGGGGFMIIYLLAIVFISFPIIVTEFLLGRRGKAGPVESIINVAREGNSSAGWSIAAYAGMLAALLAMSFYFVITGWIIYYALQMISGNLHGLSPDKVGQFFTSLTQNELTTTAYHSFAAFLCWMIVIGGLKNGIERVVRYLMPLLIILLLGFTVYSAIAGDLQTALRFLFLVKPDDISAQTVLYASGQALFTVGAGSCVMIVYGSYLPQSVSLMKSSFQIIAMDTLIALLAGIAIFPLVFAYNLEPAEGPGLLFVTLPIAFSQSATGSVAGAVFFLMVAIAAITSAIAIVQAPIVWVERTFKLKHLTASTLCFILIWILGLGTVCSFDSCSTVYPLGFVPVFSEMNFFALMEMFAINICLPLGTFLLAVFIGWGLPKTISFDELKNNNPVLIRCWYYCMRYVVPPSILFIMYFGLLGGD
ncbi:MAG: sodium-dependent transporter [Gammaproteobacteria bacterium]|nr:sodium-dependent transporter [Gammaproteobacteria bacterium]